MKLEKAIEILTIHNDHNSYITDNDREDAHRLGLEALKVLIKWRLAESTKYFYLLPGETKED